jgi:quinol monooxygenase YgiN
VDSQTFQAFENTLRRRRRKWPRRPVATALRLQSSSGSQIGRFPFRSRSGKVVQVNTRSAKAGTPTKWEQPLIVVLATIELHSGKRNDFLAEFQKIIEPVRAENGCLEYFPTTDHATNLPAQGPAREDVVVVVEKWESIEALEAHLIAPHMMTYRPRVKDYVKRVSLQILSPAVI